MADGIDHRELERRSQDRLKVLNPTKQDHVVVWDGFVHKVPAGGDAIFPRYIAEKYMREATDRLLIQL
jgi:hypothetical protein